MPLNITLTTPSPSSSNIQLTPDSSNNIALSGTCYPTATTLDVWVTPIAPTPGAAVAGTVPMSAPTPPNWGMQVNLSPSAFPDGTTVLIVIYAVGPTGCGDATLSILAKVHRTGTPRKKKK